MSLWKNTDTHAGRPKFLSLGQLEAIHVTAGGTGYTPANGTAGAVISAPPAGGVQATATITIIGGVISSVAIDNPGAGYTTSPTVTYAVAGVNGVMNSTAKSVATPNGTVVFVDEIEALVPANRLKGIKTPGWMVYNEFVNSSGATRYKHDVLIAMTIPAAVAGDSTVDNAIVGNTQFVVSAQPLAVVTNGGIAVSYTVAAAGATSYQWQIRTGGAGQYTNIANAGIYSNATTAILGLSTGTVKALSGNTYRCIVANTTAGASATSAPVALTVNFGVATQPSPVTSVAPAISSFTVGAVEVSTYQWQIQALGVGPWANIANAGVYSAATTATLGVSASTGLNSNKYRVIISDGVTTVTSTDALFTVNYVISTQPANLTVIAPAAASFTILAVGATTYQWQLLVAAVWTNITNGGVYSNATTATLNISNSTGLSTNQYRVNISDGFTPVTSAVAVLTA